ncbi:MAG: MotA/TolQ/ExbB proton channel family protein [Planctomycetes bacterium]|nr:MotA/TolQ/ExbB proton channel family protein [Planctomycetota bacterium]
MSSAKSRRFAPAVNIATPAAPWEIILTPWVCGPVLTGVFHFVLSQAPTGLDTLARTLTGHWTSYVAAGLFFTGVAVLLRKILGLILDHRALKLVVIDADSLDGIETPRERATELMASTAMIPNSFLRTKEVSRIHEVCQYIQGCHSKSSLEDYLRYRADLALEALSHSYALVRTIIWGVPLVGALGLVLGIISTIHSVNPQDLDASMPGIVAGFENAFVPLAVSLGLSLTLVFGKLFVERAETQVLSRIEQFGILQVSPCFHFPESQTSLVGHAPVAGHAFQQSADLVTQQTQMWQSALEQMRTRWTEIAESQQAKFAVALEQGMQGTLTGHQRQLEEARSEFLHCFRAVGMELTRVTAGLQQMGEEHQQAFHQQLAEIWQSTLAAMSADRQDHTQKIEKLITVFEKSAHTWRDDFARATESLTAQIGELQQRNELLQSVAEEEQALVRLQDTLTHNLQSVRAIEAFEESIHSLNAAVHMLTIRAKAHAA